MTATRSAPVAASRAIAGVASCLVAAGLMAYALTYRVPVRSPASRPFIFAQQTFYATRVVRHKGFVVQSLRLRTDGGNVEVSWYDSDLASLARSNGIYAALFIDGQDVTSELTGSYFGPSSRGPATLRWAGGLPAGQHRFSIVLARVDTGADVPYVAPGHQGLDNLVVTEIPGAG